MGFESDGLHSDAFLKRKGNTQRKGPCEAKAATRSKKPYYAWTYQKPGRQTSTLPFSSKTCSSESTLTSDFQLPRPGENMLLLFLCFGFWFLEIGSHTGQAGLKFTGDECTGRFWVNLFFFSRNIGAHCQDYTLINPFMELGVATICTKLQNFCIE